MAELKTFTCDVCGVQKREANHWFAVLRGDAAVTIITYQRSVETHLRCNLRPGNEVADTCGEKCTLVKVSEFLRTPYPMKEAALA